MIKEVYYHKEKYQPNLSQIINYSPEMETKIEKIAQFFAQKNEFKNYSSRWLAIRILAGDKHVENLIKEVV